MTGRSALGRGDSGPERHEEPDDAVSGMPSDRTEEASHGEDAFRLPIDGTLDLHAFRPADVRSVVEEYVREAHAAGLREIRIVHGRGTGVLRGVVQATLEVHPLVEAFRDDTDSHLGATWARLGARG